MSRSSKRVLDKCYALVGDWAAGPGYSIIPLMDELKKYDETKFFDAVKAGYERAIKNRKDNNNG